jgi:hypothetical protein
MSNLEEKWTSAKETSNQISVNLKSYCPVLLLSAVCFTDVSAVMSQKQPSPFISSELSLSNCFIWAMGRPWLILGLNANAWAQKCRPTERRNSAELHYIKARYRTSPEHPTDNSKHSNLCKTVVCRRSMLWEASSNFPLESGHRPHPVTALTRHIVCSSAENNGIIQGCKRWTQETVMVVSVVLWGFWHLWTSAKLFSCLITWKLLWIKQKSKYYCSLVILLVIWLQMH